MGGTRDVQARELLSGRAIRRICRRAVRFARKRSSRLDFEDMNAALEEYKQRLRQTLTSLTENNIHQYLDVEPYSVASITCAEEAVPSSSHKYLVLDI